MGRVDPPRRLESSHGFELGAQGQWCAQSIRVVRGLAVHRTRSGKRFCGGGRRRRKRQLSNHHLQPPRARNTHRVLGPHHAHRALRGPRVPQPTPSLCLLGVVCHASRASKRRLGRGHGGVGCHARRALARGLGHPNLAQRPGQANPCVVRHQPAVLRRSRAASTCGARREAPLGGLAVHRSRERRRTVARPPRLFWGAPFTPTRRKHHGVHLCARTRVRRPCTRRPTMAESCCAT